MRLTGYFCGKWSLPEAYDCLMYPKKQLSGIHLKYDKGNIPMRCLNEKHLEGLVNGWELILAEKKWLASMPLVLSKIKKKNYKVHSLEYWLKFW